MQQTRHGQDEASLLILVLGRPLEREVKTVFRVDTDQGAPRFELLAPMPSAPSLLTFDGRRKAPVWPVPPPQVRADRLPESAYTFYYLAPGALVVREDVLATCEDFDWVTCEGDEPLLVMCGEVRFEVINIVDFVSPPAAATLGGGPPCPVDEHYKALLRINGRPPEQLFCVSGVGNPLNEFKGVYDHHGFSGLTFTEVWRGEG